MSEWSRRSPGRSLNAEGEVLQSLTHGGHVAASQFLRQWEQVSFADLLKRLHEAHAYEVGYLRREVTRLELLMDKKAGQEAQPSSTGALASQPVAAAAEAEEEGAVTSMPRTSRAPAADSSASRQSTPASRQSTPTRAESKIAEGGSSILRDKASIKTVVSLEDPRAEEGEARETRSKNMTKKRLGSFWQEETRESVPDGDGSKHTFVGIVTGPVFEMVFAGILFFNCIQMMIDAQCVGTSIGLDLTYYREFQFTKCSPEVSHVLDVVDFICGSCFTLEVCLKLIALRLQTFKSAWFLVDIIAVACWLTPHMMSKFSLIKMARMARVVRLFRLLKALHSLDAMFLMTTAISNSLSVLGWAMGLLFLVQAVIALTLQHVLNESYFLEDKYALEDKLEVYEYFGTFSRSLLSMFEVTLANWPPVCRVLTENVSEWFMLLAVTHKLVIGFAVVGVINGVFMQETFKAASSDDRMMVRMKERAMALHQRRMQMLFESADRSGDGVISREEWMSVVSKPHVKMWLSSMDLDATDADAVYQLVDKNGDGHVDEEELVRGIACLKGPARNLDVVKLCDVVHKLKLDMRSISAQVASSLQKSTEGFDKISAQLCAGGDAIFTSSYLDTKHVQENSSFQHKMDIEKGHKAESSVPPANADPTWKNFIPSAELKRPSQKHVSQRLSQNGADELRPSAAITIEKPDQPQQPLSQQQPQQQQQPAMLPHVRV